MSSTDAELEALIDSVVQNPPNNFFCTVPCKDSIPVRRFTFALEEVVAHLNKRYSEDVTSLIKKIVYKQSGPQRHQVFWRKFRYAARYVHKYNSPSILKFASDLLKRLSSSSSFFYMPTPSTIQFLAASLLAQLYMLYEIRQGCAAVVHALMGQLELGHWEKMSIFLVALCGELFSTARDQAKAICAAYKKISEFLTSEVNRMPTQAADLKFVSAMCEQTSSDRTSNDTERVRILLKMSDEEFDKAIMADRMESIRKEVLAKFSWQTAPVDLGTSVVRENDETEILVNENTIVSDVENNNKSKKIKKAKKRKSSQMDVTRTDSLASLADADSTCSFDVTSSKRPKISSNDSAIGEFTDLDVSVFEPTAVSTPYPKKLKNKLFNSSVMSHNVLDTTTASEITDEQTPVPKKKLKRKIRKQPLATECDSSMADPITASDSYMENSRHENTDVQTKKLKKKRKLVTKKQANTSADQTFTSDFEEVKTGGNSSQVNSYAGKKRKIKKKVLL